jgi:hypothetical protein
MRGFLSSPLVVSPKLATFYREQVGALHEALGQEAIALDPAAVTTRWQVTLEKISGRSVAR